MNGFTFPDPSRLPGKPKRVICHWTAGGYTASLHDREHYHALIEWRDGEAHIVAGVPIVNNMAALGPGIPTYHGEDAPHGYAPHTRDFNSWSIGYAICGMFSALDRGNIGDFPIRPEQVDILIGLCATTAAAFGLEVTEDTFFTHFEAQSIHGVTQRGKWDITVIPWLLEELGPDDVGPWLRAQVRERLEVDG